MNNFRLNLRYIHDRLFEAYGPQYWWPAKTSFEVMVGAVLTQGTAWRNVEGAIANLADSDALEPGPMIAMPEEDLAELIRPAGYFRIKAKRLRAYCKFYLEHGQRKGLNTLTTADLRTKLLAVYGVGPETADSVLLYAFDRPVFVIDAYTKRIFQRLGLPGADMSYENVQQHFHDCLHADATLFNEYHALIVEHAKRHCRARPICTACPLLNLCLAEPVNIQRSKSIQ